VNNHNLTNLNLYYGVINTGLKNISQ